MTGAALITGETVHLVTVRNRHGSGNYAFSTKEAADAYALKHARKIWDEREPDDAPEDETEFWEAFYRRFDDEDIETDHAIIDEEG